MSKTKNKNPIPHTQKEAFDIELDLGANDSTRLESNHSSSETSAFNLLNLCHGAYENIAACGNQYFTKENAILAAGGICALGAIAGLITVIVLYAVPDCKKELTFEVRTDDEVKFPGKPVLYKYDSRDFHAPATKEEEYDEAFTINPASLWPNDCKLNVNVGRLTKKCDISGYELNQQAFTCNWRLEKTGSDNDSSSKQQDSFVASANALYSRFFNPSKSFHEEEVEYNAPALG